MIIDITYSPPESSASPLDDEPVTTLVLITHHDDFIHTNATTS